MEEGLSHPYRGLPEHMFWKSAVEDQAPQSFDPVIDSKLRISRHDVVAAAGSCFAQHIARHLVASGFNYLQAEPPKTPSEPIFSAQYGNVYTIRQLRQLLLRAYGLHRPTDIAWRRDDGKWIDPLRPQMFPEGFLSPAEVEAAAIEHLRAVRRVFEESRVFVFTLGLTESWMAEDGTIVPIPPGVVAVETTGGRYSFHNFTAVEMINEMGRFIADFRGVNPEAHVILTVSPVPLVATYENRHVLVSNTYSKSALRVVAEEAARANDNVTYFPSYEIIMSPSVRFGYFCSDLRSVTDVGVSHVMQIFARHFLQESDVTTAEPSHCTVRVEAPESKVLVSSELQKSFQQIEGILCDEELLHAGGGR